QIRDQFKDLPTHERQYLYLQSKLQVNQNIYALLLNKELETALIKAGLLPTLTVLTPVEVELLFPKKLHTLVLFLFGGLFLSDRKLGINLKIFLPTKDNTFISKVNCR